MDTGSGSTEWTEFPGYHPFRSEEAKRKYLDLYDLRAKEWPVPSVTQMVDTSWGRTFVRMSGPEGSPPLVLLPGAASTSLMWIPNVRALSRNYRTYAVDNIYDFGRSIYTRPIRTAGDYAGWLDELVNALEPRAAINLVGMSYGGWLAGLYSMHFPERVDKTVLLAPPGIVMGLSLKFMLRAVMVLLPRRYTIRKFMGWIFEGLLRKGESGREALEMLSDDVLTAFRCFKPRRFIPPRRLKDEELRKLRGPLLFMVGGNEKIYSAGKAVQRLNRIVPWIRTEIIPGADHAFTFAEADIVNEKILGFLRQA